MSKEIICVGCQRKLDKGETYLEKDPHFGEPVGMCCYDDLKEHLKDAEDWHSLQEIDNVKWLKVGSDE